MAGPSLSAYHYDNAFGKKALIVRYKGKMEQVFLIFTLRTRWLSLGGVLIESKVHKNKHKGPCRRILTPMRWRNQVVQLMRAIHLEHERETTRGLSNYKKRKKIEAEEGDFLAVFGGSFG